MFADYSESGAPLLGNPEHKLNATFRLTDANVTIANNLRRAILVQTPSVAFRSEPFDKSDIIISKNTTPLVNEMISHRIGMVPIRADPLTFEPELYEFVLDIENNTKKDVDVHASDFKVYKKDPERPLEPPVQVPTADFFPPDPITGDTCLITRLRPQWNPTAPMEGLKLKAKASVSTGTENIRWSPVCQASYSYTRDPDPAKEEKIYQAWLSANKKISDPSSLDFERQHDLRAEFNTMEIQRCYLQNTKGEPYDFTFQVESVGIQAVPMIVRSGIAAVEAMVTKYVDLDSVLPPNVRVHQADSRFPAIDVIFQDEGHGLGNLLETYLVENHIDGGAVPTIQYAGYKVPHPLRHEMFVRIGVEGDKETQAQTARLAVASVCRHLKEYLQALGKSWEAMFAAPAEAPVAAE